MKNIVYVDFNNMDSSARIRLNSTGTSEDLEKMSLGLTEGMVLVVSDGELVSEGIVEFSIEENDWVLKLSEETVQNV